MFSGRRGFVSVAVLAIAASIATITAVFRNVTAQPALNLPDQRAADLAALDRFVRDSHAFLPIKATDWNRVISTLIPPARAARDHTAWLHVLEKALDAYMTAICN
jgi:hypothetical protein